MPFADGVRKLPLTKLIALYFTVFVCILIVLDVTTLCPLTERSADLVKWLGSTIIVSYFGKSAYEHNVNVRKGEKS